MFCWLLVAGCYVKHQAECIRPGRDIWCLVVVVLLLIINYLIADILSTRYHSYVIIKHNQTTHSHIHRLAPALTGPLHLHQLSSKQAL